MLYYILFAAVISIGVNLRKRDDNMPKFVELDPLELQDNMFRRIGRE